VWRALSSALWTKRWLTTLLKPVGEDSRVKFGLGASWVQLEGLFLS